jgi:hypothetical protein
VIPPSDPTHLQLHGPFPVTLEAFPALHRFDVGALRKSSPLAEPHTPLPAGTLAEQLAFAPPFAPWHVQDQGPVPLTEEAAPELHRLDVGADVSVAPLLLPHTPLTSRLAEQLAFVPPFDPEQAQVQGPVPERAEAVPVLQSRFDAGAVEYD